MRNFSKKWVVLAVVSTALLLIAIDMTVLYIALPNLTRSLNATAAEKLWIVNIYPLVVSGLLLGTGTLGDHIGHKRLFVYGLMIFGGASFMAACAPSPAVLIFSRALLGIGAATMMPATLSIVTWTFVEENERSLAIGIWGAVASGGAAVGPLIGGLLLEYYWWGSVFLINVPLVILALVLSKMFIPDDHPDHARPWDLVGSLQIMVFLITAAYSIKELSKQCPSGMAVAITLALAVVFLRLFIRRQHRSTYPLVDFALFKNSAFSSSVVAGGISSACLMGVDLALSQRLQLVQSLSPLQTGLYFLPLSLGAIMASPLSGWILPRFGSARLLCTALLLYALSILAFMASLAASLHLQLACLWVLGACVGSAMTTASSTIMQAAPANRAGMAASIEAISYELGGGMGITIMGSLMSAIYHRTLVLPPGLSINVVAAARDGIDGVLNVADNITPALRLVLVLRARSAFDTAVLTIMGSASLLLFATAAHVWLNFHRRSPKVGISTQ